MKLSIALFACVVCVATAADANQKLKTSTGGDDLAKEKRGAAKNTVTVGVQQPIQQLEYLQPQQQHEQADVAYVQQPQQPLAYLQAQPQFQYLHAQPQLQQLSYLQAQPQVPLTYLQAQPHPQVTYLQPQQQLLSYAQPQQQLLSYAQPQQHQPTVTYYSQEQQQLPQRSLSPQQLYAKYQSAPRTPAQTSAAVAEYLQGGQSQSLGLAPASAGVQYSQIPVASLGLGYSSLFNAAQQQPLLELSGAAAAGNGAGYEVTPPAQSYRAPPPQAVQGRGLQIYQQPYIAQIQAQAESAQRQLNSLYQQQQQQQQQLLQQQQILQPQQEVKG